MRKEPTTAAGRAAAACIDMDYPNWHWQFGGPNEGILAVECEVREELNTQIEKLAGALTTAVIAERQSHARLRLLKPYLAHWPDCPDIDGRCSCGLDALLVERGA